MITLPYLPVTFKIRFNKDIVNSSSLYSIFVLRSVLGYNLKSISCIAHQKECIECEYNRTCAYAFIFETILSKDNNIQPGTNRAAHPFVLYDYTGSSFSIILFGDAIKYLPYVYAAFYKAGQKGLFKERIPFEIEDINVDDESLLIDEERIKTDIQPLIWNFARKEDIKYSKEVFVELKTPLRFKVLGHYSKDFSAKDFMQCIYRRMKTLCFLYGTFTEIPQYKNEDIQLEITEKKIRWSDSTHYSARQKTAMELGGVCGNFKMKGEFSEFEMALIDFAKKFSAGKNPNFGLGRIDYWERNI